MYTLYVLCRMYPILCEWKASSFLYLPIPCSPLYYQKGLSIGLGTNQTLWSVSYGVAVRGRINQNLLMESCTTRTQRFLWLIWGNFPFPLWPGPQCSIVYHPMTLWGGFCERLKERSEAQTASHLYNARNTTFCFWLGLCVFCFSWHGHTILGDAYLLDLSHSAV